jgi:putative aminopeptidase FrvX
MNLLQNLYRTSSPSGHETLMMNFIRSQLDKLGVTHVSDKKGNIYATKGIAASYPCVISHTDEVHYSHEKGYKVLQAGSKGNKIIFGFNGFTRSYCGIGADDKNGIWICLKCLEDFDTMKCVFFVGEEIGCQGSSNADMSFFEDCRYVLQCDRKGNGDMVTFYCGNTLCSDDFLLDASPDKFGYRQTEGLITDVITLKKKGLKVACANLSCGYYHPHTPHEFTCVEDLMKCYEFVQHIVKNCNKTYPHQIIQKDYYEYLFDDTFEYMEKSYIHQKWEQYANRDRNNQRVYNRNRIFSLHGCEDF